MSEVNGNGNGNEQRPQAKLTIAMDLLTHTIKCDANAPNIDCTLSMLAAATRAFEAQLRQAQAIAFAAQQREAVQAEQVRRMIGKG